MREKDVGAIVDTEWRDNAALATDITLDAMFRRAFSLFADRIAVSWEDGQRRYAEVGDRAWRLANALVSRGVTRGDTIAILSETRPEYIECYAALAALGVTVATLNIRLHPRELAACIHKSRPCALIVSDSLAPLAESLRSETTGVQLWVSFGETTGFEGYEDLLRNSTPEVPRQVVNGSDIHNILFTSGTTGVPKAALISQRAAATRGLRLAQWFSLTENDGFVGWLPLFHCGGDESLYATFMTGGTYATLRRADVRQMFRLIERDRLTWTLLLPGVITDFLDHSERLTHDLSSLRFAIGYANMMPQVIQRLTDACNIDFYDAFGQSEVSYLLAHRRSGPGEMPPLRKLPSPMLQIRIVDADMNDMPPGQPGECVVRGPSVMSGYLDDDAANAEVFKGGWLHTGDILRREDDGTLTFVDRKRYLIKSGGENVYPAEVEAVIGQHPAVQEVCVFGIPDEHWGETVKAVVVLRPDAKTDRQQIVDWCREHLSGYKRPRVLQFAHSEDLPRSITGKLQRQKLSCLEFADDLSVN
ncbi:acyl--CoA ligase [Aromatoleum toluclasticum]|uniref:class I adenylate-forming enzyme family protein n=1 Tax=Aromatoleum toluclasticum TaxID=92003 RepID=UPI001D186A36|nr:class I adenylate-forming enzyme family protein [Aromatoleum toluclasticum]MCC4113958.1 acyl--CoA ligase [Aromatoleum toluclasticum]